MLQVMATSDESRALPRGERSPDPSPYAIASFRDLVEWLPLVVYIDSPDVQSRSLYISPQTTAAFGYTPEDWAASPDFLESILHPDDRERVQAEMASMLVSGERLDSEYRLIRRDGSVAWVRDEGVLVRDDDGEPLCLQGYMLDISERKRSQALASGQADLLEFIATGAALHAVLDRLARFVEAHADDLVVSIQVLDRDGERLRHAAAPSLPAAYCEAIDGPIGPMAGAAGAAVHRREPVLVRVIAGDPIFADRHAVAAAAGLQGCWATPIFATDGGLLGTLTFYSRDSRQRTSADTGLVELVGLASHLTRIAIEHSRNENAARASEARYRDLFENASEPIATVAVDRQILEVNQAFASVLGYSRDELVGTNMADYFVIDALDLTRQPAAGAGEWRTYEQEFLTKAGDVVVLEVSRRAIEEDGRALAYQGICRDITDRKRVDRELQRLSDLNRHQALHDHLTGLPNRAAFLQQVDHAIGIAAADGSHLGVVPMDLDGFKAINDTLGHRRGDLVLVELAVRRLVALLRPSDRWLASAATSSRSCSGSSPATRRCSSECSRR